ncbi:ABC transporter permease [Paenibacillus sacheonensis]|uniref:ABC transporter permease n=1 Tax=Paenibacillus sacheonensis TaxID=742054 RepID=A0A7X5BVR4_9BACL|nr:ABC transporter permease [Paenibacillus sacheonensis]MBM7566078.1 ABC-2 type transport system permease protein [Paenibacillus sacheonensis]NBC68613.1 ABC transporter permease [Paenibacillus sacheonensis]
MNNGFWTVVGFTAKNKLRGKAFLVTTLIIAVIMSIGINLPYIISQFSGEGKATVVGYLDSTADKTSSQLFTPTRIADMLNKYYGAQEKPELKIVPIADAGSADANEKALKQAVSDDVIDGYLAFTPDPESGFPAVTYKSESLMESKVSQSLKTSLQAVKMDAVINGGGLSKELKALLTKPIELNTVQISTAAGAGSIDGQGKTTEQQGMDMATVYVIIFMLFMAIMISGQMIASEITAEKSSRVMEILITSVAPLKAMFGKILGMFLVVLLQLAVYVVVIVINMTLPQNADKLSEFGISLNEIDPVLLVYAVVFFLTGFFLFATLFAAVGSIVSRTEDLGQAVLPITMLSLAGFYICMFGGLNNPGSMLMKVSSFIPFFSPYAMVVRLGLSDPPLWQVWLSVLILLVTILIAGWLSAKIYRAGVLMYGKKPSMKELFKAMRAYR